VDEQLYHTTVSGSLVDEQLYHTTVSGSLERLVLSLQKLLHSE
jgi:hypothetical protein